MSKVTSGVAESATPTTPVVGYIARKPHSIAPAYFCRIAEAAAQNGIDVVQLTCGGITLVHGTPIVEVYRWNGVSVTRDHMVLPPVIIDHSNAQLKTGHRRFIRQLRSFNVRFTTTRTLRLKLSDKWMQYRIFRDAGVPTPPTERYSRANLSMFLERYALVFIKPRIASHGNGQLVVKRRRGGAYVITKSGSDTTTYFTTKKGVLNHIESRLKTRGAEKKYLVQAGISVSRIRGRVFDFRVVMQRNERGWPMMTACYIRVGKSQSFQANIHKSGHPLDPAYTIPHWGDIRRKIYLVAKAAFLACGTIGEAGIDVVLEEKTARVVCLEINTRPGVKGIEMLSRWISGDPAHQRLHVTKSRMFNRDRERWGRRLKAFYLHPSLYAAFLSQKT